MSIQVNEWDEAMKEEASCVMAARADAYQEYREKRMAAVKSRQQLPIKSDGPFVFPSAGKEWLCNAPRYSPFA